MTGTYRFADFEFDRARGELRHCGARIGLEPRVLEVLCHLLEHRSRTVPIDEILAEVWRDTTVERGSVHRAIRVLRRALGAADVGREAIETLRGRGYRFTLPVDRSDARDSVPPSPSG